MWCWRRLLRVPWTARRSNQSILKEINPEYSLEGIFCPPDVKSQHIGKDPDAGKDWRQEEKGTTEDEMFGWHHQFSGHVFSKLQEMVKDREAWRAAVHADTKSGTQLSNWTTKTRVTRVQLNLKQQQQNKPKEQTAGNKANWRAQWKGEQRNKLMALRDWQTNFWKNRKAQASSIVNFKKRTKLNYK